MGTLMGIYLADAAGAPVRRVDEAEFIAGRGIVGDRYFTGLGTYSPVVQKPSHEVTLVELEQVDDFNAAYGSRLAGLRAGIITGGTARVGDSVALRGEDQQAR